MGRILLAEDDDSVRAFVRRALEMDGHEVVEARDGAEAASVLAGDSHFDLILSDIQMPVMDGIALALTVARDHSAIPLVLMTGYAHQRERAHGIEEIVRDVIQKPFTLADIRERIAAVLAG